MLAEIIYRWALRFVNPELRGFNSFIEQQSPGWFDEYLQHINSSTLEEKKELLVEYDKIMTSLFLSFLEKNKISYSEMVEREMSFEEECDPNREWAFDKENNFIPYEGMETREFGYKELGAPCPM